MITRIELHWLRDFGGRGTMTLELTVEDQDDPRLLALRAWWDERERAKSSGTGDPFPIG